jgi:hypothetical protein
MATVPVSDEATTAVPHFPQKCWETGTSVEQRAQRGILVIEDSTAGPSSDGVLNRFGEEHAFTVVASDDSR